MDASGDGMYGTAVAGKCYSRAGLDKYIGRHLQMQEDYKAQVAGLRGS